MSNDPQATAYAAAIGHTMTRTQNAVTLLSELASKAVANDDQLEARRLLGKVEGISLILGYFDDELKAQGFTDDLF